MRKYARMIIAGLCLITFWATMIAMIFYFGWIAAAILLVGECAATCTVAVLEEEARDGERTEGHCDRDDRRSGKSRHCGGHCSHGMRGADREHVRGEKG